MISHRERQQKPKIGLIVLVTLAFSIMVVSVILAIKFPVDDSWKNPNDTDINNPALSGFVCDATEAQMLYPMGNGLVKVSRNRISYLNLKGTEIFGEIVNMESPICRISEDKALIADTNGVTYMALDTTHVLFSSTAQNTLDYGSINKDGNIVLLMDEPGVKGVARVLKADGQGLFAWKSAQSGYILAGQVSPDSKYTDISIINTDGAATQPIFKRFGMKGEAVAQYMPKTEEIMPVIIYDSDNNPVICGQSNVVAYDNTKEKYHLTFSKIYTVASSNRGIVLVAKRNSNEIPKLYLIDIDGEISGGIALSEEVTPIAVNGDIAIVGSGNSVVSVSLDKMKEISRTPVSATTVRVAFSTSSNRAIVVARDGVTTFIIK
jgi:hypothetical protein